MSGARRFATWKKDWAGERSLRFSLGQSEKKGELRSPWTAEGRHPYATPLSRRLLR
jgi:hypothetical protein